MALISKKTIDKIFHIGILLKALFGFFEILAGIFVAVSGQKMIDNFLIDIALNEIARDPDDFLARRFVFFAVSLYSDAKLFAIAYLVLHGVINIFLAVALIKNKLWAFPAAITAFCAFIAYQLYKYLHTHSLLTILLTLFDLLVVIVIWLEYRKQKLRLKGFMTIPKKILG